MPFERVDLKRRASPSELAEWMDDPCSYEDFRTCLVDLAKVNRVTQGYRPTLRWMDRVAAKSDRKKPLHIVDVGCGGGDMLFAIAAWARQRDIEVKLTGVDLNPHAARAAKELAPAGSAIEWLTGDAFSYMATDGIDVVVSSLLTHHLEDKEIAGFIAWMEGVAQRGWFINDLHRSRIFIYGFRVLSSVFRWHRFVRHDGPVSFYRSFRKADWKRLCTVAAIDLDAVRIETYFPGRLCIGRLK